MKEPLKQFFFYLLIKYRIPSSALDNVNVLDVFDSKTTELILEILNNNYKLVYPVEENVSAIKNFNIVNRHLQIYNDLFPDAPDIIEPPVFPSLKEMASREINKLIISKDMLKSVLMFFKPPFIKTDQEKFIDKLKSKVKLLRDDLRKELDLLEPGYYFFYTLNDETIKLKKEFTQRLFFFGEKIYASDLDKFNFSREDTSELTSSAWTEKLFITLIKAYKENNINYACFAEIQPLHWACVLGDEHLVSQIITAGANVNALCTCRASDDQNSFWGQATPLYLASWHGNSAMIQCLLKAQADPNLICAGNQTALHKAAESNTIETIEFLLNAGANHTLRASMNRKVMNLTPFDCALLNNNFDTALWFIKQGLVSYLNAIYPTNNEFPQTSDQHLKEKFLKNMIKVISLLPEGYKCTEGSYLYEHIRTTLEKENLESDCRKRLKCIIETAVSKEMTSLTFQH